MNDRVNLSSLLSGTVDQLQAKGRLVLIYLAVMTPLLAASSYFEQQGGANQSAFNIGLTVDQALMAQGALPVVVVIGVFVIGMLANYWLIAGMTRHTDAPSFDRFFPYLGIYFLFSLAIVFGFVLFIIPGIILFIRWTPLLPCVINRRGLAMDAFGESWGMTSGYSWSIFGAGLIIVICVIFAGIVIGLMGYALGNGSVLVNFVSAVLETGLTVVGVAFSVTVYFQLRDDSGELAEVFE